MPAASLLFLGTGTSHGVPTIGCDCPVCRSADPHNHRLRTSALARIGDVQFLFDAGIDFRQQALRHHIHRIDAILQTHAHSDHMFGLDEMRVFNKLQDNSVRCYGNTECLERIRHVFDFMFREQEPVGGGVSSLELIPLQQPTNIAGVEVTPIPLWHGPLPILGYRLGRLAYCTDCNKIPDTSLALLQNLDVLVLDCLRPKPHPTHFNLAQAVETARIIDAERTYFVHMCHDLEHEATNRRLPAGMQLAYDGLAIAWDAT